MLPGVPGFTVEAAAVQATCEACRDRVSSDLQVIDHYEKPRNVGAFSKLDNSVGTGLVGAPACGDVMKLQIKVYLHTEYAYSRCHGALHKVFAYRTCKSA